MSTSTQNSPCDESGSQESGTKKFNRFTIANGLLTHPNSVDQNHETDHKEAYEVLKRKYENLIEDHRALTKAYEALSCREVRLKAERDFVLNRLLQYEDDIASSGSDTEEAPTEDETPRRPMKRKRAQRDNSKDQCTAVVDNRKCKSKALAGFSYCRHHAPLDPASPYVFCSHRDKKRKTGCQMPIEKGKDPPYCSYHLPEHTEGAPNDSEEKDEDADNDDIEESKHSLLHEASTKSK